MAKSRFYRVTANDPSLGGKEISSDLHHTTPDMSFAVWVEKNLSYLDNVKYEPLDRALDNEIKNLLDKVKTCVADPLSNAQARERLECCRHMAALVGIGTQESLRNVLYRITDKDYEIVSLFGSPFSFGLKYAGMYVCMFFHENDQTWTLNS